MAKRSEKVESETSESVKKGSESKNRGERSKSADLGFDLCHDVAFKRVFGDGKAKLALMGLMNAGLKQANMPLVVDFKYLNPIQKGQAFNGKDTILDILVEDARRGRVLFCHCNLGKLPARVAG